MNQRAVGAEYEERTKAYLDKFHVKIIAMNFRCKIGEIDLIGYDGKCLVFFEVKYRTSKASGFAEESVTPAKQKTILKVAQYYCMMNHISPMKEMRFDVVAWNGTEITWYKNAF